MSELFSFPETFVLSRWVFLRALGVIYFCAFLSLTVQIRGLIGEKGILPLGEFLEDLHSRFKKPVWHLLPTIFWFKSSDRALFSVCGIGLLASVCLIFGFLELPALIILFVSYLSLTVAGQDFLSFQWDVLLIETGFLAIWVAPWQLWTGTTAASGVSPFAFFLLWWLLFRLMFESGAVKLSCGDETWRRLTSLEVHYQTQPLPHRVAWYAHQLPAGFQRFCVAAVLLIELVLPLLIFAPAPLRYIAAGAFVFLMLTIFLSGNYNFFNLLTMALCVPLIDDSVWHMVIPLAWQAEQQSQASMTTWGSWPWSWYVHAGLAALIVVLSLPQLMESAWPDFKTPSWIQSLQRHVQPFHIISSYGLFRHMTRTRPEIILEGSMDGSTWKAYEFRYKPGDLRVAPRFVAPHQPRLDWQMWFAALSSFYRTRWFQSLVLRLFEGSEPVLRLLQSSPFPEAPRYIRAVLYEYEFTTPAEKKASGHWWKRKNPGLYAPVMMRRDATDYEEFEG
jgi:hypothetical protein